MRESSDRLFVLFLAVTSLEAQRFVCHVSQNVRIFCCISTLSVPWRTIRVPSVGPSLELTTGNYRCCSPCLRIATNAPWYIDNKQIHDDLGISYFSDRIRFLTGFGDLVISMLASGTQVRGSKPGRSRRIFRAKKSAACLPSEGE
jgi:hypothetical protein